MRMKTLILLFALLGITTVIATEQETFKLIKRSFSEKGTEYYSPAFVNGNRRVAVREFSLNKYVAARNNLISVFIDDQNVLKLTLGGGIGLKDGTWIPFASPNADFSITDEAVVYKIEYQLADGSPKIFTWSLKSISENSVELEWNIGVDKDMLKSIAKYGALGLFIDCDLSKTKIGDMAIKIEEQSELESISPKKKSTYTKDVKTLNIDQKLSFNINANFLAFHVEQWFAHEKLNSQIRVSELDPQGKLNITFL